MAALPIEHFSATIPAEADERNEGRASTRMGDSTVTGLAGEGPPLPQPEAAPLRANAVRLRALWVSLLLLVVAFAPTIVRTVQRWWDDPEYGHGFLMPLVAFWLIRRRKDDIPSLQGGTSIVAPLVLIVCVLGMLVGELDFLTSVGAYAFVGALGAVLLAYLGWKGLRVFMPALIVLALACPMPGLVERKITLPLKEVAAKMATTLLQYTGVQAWREGNMIHLEGAESLWVADACSGIRSFISLFSLAVVACLVWPRHWLMKVAVLVAVVPIAVFVNGFRIWLTGWLSVNVSEEAADGAFHFFEGFALFGLAGVLLLGFAALLTWVFPKEEA